MPFGDNIPKTRSFSITDFNTFETCPLKFFVFHHLDKKYDLSEGNENLAIGNVLDLSIKKFHKAGAYGQSVEFLPNFVLAAVREIREKAAKSVDKPSFYSTTTPFLTDEAIKKATKIFQDYYLGRDKKIKQSLGEVKFCEVLMQGQDGQMKLWGWPDTYEMGEDGVPEVVDYKFREDIEKGKERMDMIMMPKAYILLAAKDLMNKGYDRARFVVRFWQDPKEDSFFEEFTLTDAEDFIDFFKTKMEKILISREVAGCGKDWCVVCQSKDKDQFIKELEGLGYKVTSGEQFLKESSGSDTFRL